MKLRCLGVICGSIIGRSGFSYVFVVVSMCGLFCVVEDVCGTSRTELDRGKFVCRCAASSYCIGRTGGVVLLGID